MRRAGVLLAVGAVVLAAGALVVAAPSWVRPAPVAAAEAPTATAEVIRGPLRDTRTVAGILGYGEPRELRPSLVDGSGMVTWIAPLGATVARGEPLYALDGQPTLLLYGSVPQNRTLRFDTNRTPVWVELERADAAAEAAGLALRLEEERLADAEARAADADARLADALSGKPETPEFVQLAGAVAAAEAKAVRVRELSAAQVTPTLDVAIAEAELAAVRAAQDAALRALRGTLATARLDAATARVAVAGAEAELAERQSALDALATRAPDEADVAQLAENLAALGYAGPLAEQVRAWQRDTGLAVTGLVGPGQVVIAEGPVHVATHAASIGETLVAAAPDGGTILRTSGTDKLVTVPLGVDDQGLAAPGRAVAVTLPDDTVVEGTVEEMGSVVTDSATLVTVTIADQAALGGLEVASVDVEFTSESRNGVLSVPVAALLARPEGGYAVEVVANGTSVLVPVETGLFAAGRVEVSGEGLVEGMRVSVPR